MPALSQSERVRSRRPIAAFANAILMVMCTVGLAAPAPVEKEAITIMGAGTHLCSEWTDSRITAKATAPGSYDWLSAAAHQHWLLGFVSGINAARGKNALGAIDSGTIFDWMDSYCARHPKSRIYDAAEELYISLAK